jgi:hypothetical protein
MYIDLHIPTQNWTGPQPQSNASCCPEYHPNNALRRPVAGYLPSKSHTPLSLGEDTKYIFSYSRWYNPPWRVATSLVFYTTNQECFLAYPIYWLNCRRSRPPIVRALKFPEVWRGSICQDAWETADLVKASKSTYNNLHLDPLTFHQSYSVALSVYSFCSQHAQSIYYD